MEGLQELREFVDAEQKKTNDVVAETTGKIKDSKILADRPAYVAPSTSGVLKKIRLSSLSLLQLIYFVFDT